MLLTKIRTTWARPWVRRGITLLFLAFVALLVVEEARVIEWSEVADSIRSYRASTLLIASVFSALSYLIYSCFDLLGRRYTNIKLTVPTVMTVAFISFAFNQSVGSLIGAVAFRLRIYSQLGVKALTISKVIGLSVITNWLGYSAIAGVLFLSNVIALPPDMNVGPTGLDIGRGVLRTTGIAMLGTVIVYMALCAIGGGKEVRFKSKRLIIPDWKMASLQLTLSVLHWPAAAAIIYVLLNQQIEFVTILGALMLTAVAVVLTHIPAGIGVLEAIFVGLLRHRMPTTEIIAALLVYRALYNLAPLAIATVLYLKAEAGASEPTLHHAPVSRAAVRRGK